MPTALIHSDQFLNHRTGPGHPECPDRVRAVVQRLRQQHDWSDLIQLSFDRADQAAVERVHDRAYLRRLAEACAAGEPCIDCPDSAIGAESAAVAYLAAGGVIAACDAVMAGRASNAFCAVRPPGHHAERDRSMGFCLLNNVAIAAEHLIAVHGLDRVAIVDFDVHHGNGTQHHFESRRDVLFISLHEHPSYQYPGTGFAAETGVGPGQGYTLNLPLMPGSDDDVYRDAFNAKVLPALAAFDPRFLLISAGFDASEHDPLGHMKVTADGFGWMTRQLKLAADDPRGSCSGRIVSVLEGGYDLRSLAECVAMHVRVLMQPAGQDDVMAMKAGI